VPATVRRGGHEEHGLFEHEGPQPADLAIVHAEADTVRQQLADRRPGRGATIPGGSQPSHHRPGAPREPGPAHRPVAGTDSWASGDGAGQGGSFGGKVRSISANVSKTRNAKRPAPSSTVINAPAVRGENARDGPHRTRQLGSETSAWPRRFVLGRVARPALHDPLTGLANRFDRHARRRSRR
jgi:hypothetical protein